MKAVPVFSRWILLMCVAITLPETSVNAHSRADARLIHAKELLGGGFKKKIIRREKRSVGIPEFVAETTKRFLPRKFRFRSRAISNALLRSAERYELDPVFLMAVALNESSFDPHQVGSVGEIGLMQIRPSTAEWIAGLYSLEYRGERTLYDPVMNIWIGAALIHWLRREFDQNGPLYVSAYNLGPGKVREMVSSNRPPKAYVRAVLRRYVAIYEAYRARGSLTVLSQTALRKVREITN